MKRNIIVATIFIFAAFLMSLKTYFWNDNGLPPATAVKLSSNLMAPDFEIEDVSGRRMSLRDFRGQVVLLSFWTTW